MLQSSFRRMTPELSPKDGQTPVVTAQPFTNRLGCPLNVGFVKTVDFVDAGGEDIVLAVFRPGLRDRLQLEIRGVPAETVEVVSDDLQGGHVQGQRPPTDRPAVLPKVGDSLPCPGG